MSTDFLNEGIFQHYSKKNIIAPLAYTLSNTRFAFKNSKNSFTHS